MKRFFAFTASVFLFVTFISCSMGLDPAKSSGTTVSLRLAALVPPDGGRAVIQGSGYLYIQTGSTVADAKLYGPWEAGSGDKFSTDKIPPGAYDSFSIIYMDSPKLDGPLYLDSDNLTVLSALQARLSDFPRIRESCSCATLSDVSIRPNRENPIKATLIPATTTTINDGSGYLSYIPAATGGLARRFFKITPITAISNGTVLDFLTFSLVADGPLSVSRVAVYGLDGTLIGVDNKSVTLPDSAYSSWNIPCHSLRDTSCYVYIEYSGSIAATSVFNQAYMNSSRPVWYVSNYGGSDGSDAAHPCMLTEAIACINNSTCTGTRSLILTEDVMTLSTNISLTTDVRISSLGTSPCMITYGSTGQSAAPFFRVGDGVTPTSVSLVNCEIGGGMGSFNSFIDVWKYGSLILDAGSRLVTNQSTNQYNGGAIKIQSGATAKMLPGSLIVNCTAGKGGAVYVYGGTFTMDGGSIQKCYAIDGTTASGGAVCVANNGSFIMNNGVIGGSNAGEPCTSLLNGGAIGIESGTFTFVNGTISNCSATNGNGGAIWVSGSTATAVLQGGTITGCSAVYTTTGTGCGGGVYVGTNGLVNFLAHENIAGVIMTGNTAQYGDLLYKDAIGAIHVEGFPASNGSDFSLKTGYPSANIVWN